MVAMADTLPATMEPMTLPEFEGIGPIPHAQANGRAHAYVRSRSPSSNFNSLEDGLATPEVETIRPPNGIIHANGYIKESIVSEETKLTVELLQDLPDEEEEESEEEYANGDIV